MKTIRTLVSILAALVFAGVPCVAQYAPSGGDTISRGAGVFVASQYNYSPTNNYVTVGNSSTGSASITVSVASIKLGDGRVVFPYNLTSPIIVGGPTNMELVTPTAVSNCFSLTTPGQGTCQITASFSNTHGFGDPVQSGTGGLAEAVYEAYLSGGGIVAIDNQWVAGVVTGCTNCYASALTAIGSIAPYSNVAIYDTRSWAPQYWTAQGGLTTLAAPATLTATTVGFGLNGANTTGGTYTGTSTYNACIAYVDIYGQEGPCSTAFSSLTAGTGSTNQIGFSAPAASAGAVGYTVYISLASGATNLQYKVPLATYANGVMTGNGVCTLTVIEKTTAACAVTNATYGQTGSAAIVSALTLNTSPIQPLVTTVSTTSIYVPNAGGRTTYAYVPGSHIGSAGVPMAFLPYTISAADATTVPSVLGTINLPPNFMNFVGRTIEVCGKATTTASTATIGSIQFQWDAIGQNTTGKGVQIGNLGLTPATAFATTAVYTFCEQFQTTVAGSGATAGSINTIGGYLNTSGVATAAAGQGASSDPTTGAVGSLNLNSEARLNVVYVHTTGTDGAALTLQSLTVKVLN